MKSSFSDDYKIARVLYIDEQLAAMPNLHRGVDRGVPVVRLYGANNRTERVFYLSRDKNYKYGILASRREMLVNARRAIMSQLKVSPKEYRIELSAGFKLTKREWDNMQAQSNPEKIQGDLWFEDIHMRSRFEVNTAIVLRNLGLEFKYEPERV